jgi:hypothetical protein
MSRRRESRPSLRSLMKANLQPPGTRAPGGRDPRFEELDRLIEAESKNWKFRTEPEEEPEPATPKTQGAGV